jgi:hypothetical protein
MKRVFAFATLAMVAGIAHAADPAPIEGSTAAGDRVRLYSNGRWEYVDAKKAAVQKPIVQAYDKQHDDAEALKQGGLFGVGRKVAPGDPDYNRGSLGGKH